MSQQTQQRRKGSTSQRKLNLKPLEQQVIVITGASSGIGLTTARMAAERGARVVVAARSEDALQELTREIEETGGEATYVVADVSDRGDVREIAQVAEATYGGFDTWINVAGEFIYGRLEDTPVEDMREQFETNVWGLLYGSLEAADHLKRRFGPGGTESTGREGATGNRRGGAIINIGSVVSDRALPLQGSYSASKQAVKGFTDALRMELEEEGAPVSVTLIKPTSIDTPYPEHAKNYMGEEADLPAPAYAPETAARAILDAAENPQRDVFVGGAAKGLSALGKYASGLMDTVMEKLFFRQQKKDRPASSNEENIVDGPVGDLEERGDYEGYVAERSAYTAATQRRSRLTRALAGVGVGALALLARRWRSKGKDSSRSADRDEAATAERESESGESEPGVSVVTVPETRERARRRRRGESDSP